MNNSCLYVLSSFNKYNFIHRPDKSISEDQKIQNIPPPAGSTVNPSVHIRKSYIPIHLDLNVILANLSLSLEDSSRIMENGKEII